MLPTEVGVVGFGGQGIHAGGSGAVPAFGDNVRLAGGTSKWLWEGEPRKFEPPPDLIIYNQGANDGEAGTKSVYSPLFIEVVKGLMAAVPTARQLLLLPFNAEQHRADILRVVSAAQRARPT